MANGKRKIKKKKSTCRKNVKSAAAQKGELTKERGNILQLTFVGGSKKSSKKKGLFRGEGVQTLEKDFPPETILEGGQRREKGKREGYRNQRTGQIKQEKVCRGGETSLKEEGKGQAKPRRNGKKLGLKR